MNKLITHTDLDGISCELLLRVQNKIKLNAVVNCNYSDVDNEVLKGQNGDMLYITDLSCSKDVLLEVLNRGVHVTVIDHHKTALWINEINHPNLISVVDISKSGTLLTYLYLIDMGCDIYDYKDYVNVVNDHDLWLCKDPRSPQVASLLALLGKENFISRFINNSDITTFDSTEQILLSIEEKRMSKAIETALNNVVYKSDVNDNLYGIVYTGGDFTSEIGNAIADIEGITYAIIVQMHIRPSPNSKLGVVSLRSRDKVDVSNIAQKHGGGGHKNAAGFLLENWDPEFFGIDIRVDI